MLVGREAREGGKGEEQRGKEERGGREGRKGRLSVWLACEFGKKERDRERVDDTRRALRNSFSTPALQACACVCPAIPTLPLHTPTPQEGRKGSKGRRGGGKEGKEREGRGQAKRAPPGGRLCARARTGGWASCEAGGPAHVCGRVSRRI